VFIENNPSRHEALLRLQAAHPERAIECYRDDANVLVRAICKGNRWRAPRAAGRSARAVLFLDPYGMQVEWQTLQSIRETRAIDLLYLFPIGAILRQAALDPARSIRIRTRRSPASMERAAGGRNGTLNLARAIF
jgi:three-Cys-motif partner protein